MFESKRIKPALLAGLLSVTGSFAFAVELGFKVSGQDRDFAEYLKSATLTSDLKDKDAVVVVFTCNSCPYAVDYEDRLIAFHKKFASQNVALVAINVNKVPEDALPAMKKSPVYDGVKECASSSPTPAPAGPPDVILLPL